MSEECDQPILVKLLNEPRHVRSIIITFAAFCLAVLLPFMIAFSQYVESTASDDIAKVESRFSSAVDRLSSDTSAVRSEAIRQLYLASFSDSPTPPSHGFSGVFTNVMSWLLGYQEKAHLDRGRTLFRDYLKETHFENEVDQRVFSTGLGIVALDWVNAEKENGSDVSDYEFLLREANLPGANFSRSDLSALSVSEANLERAEFSYSTLDRVDLYNSKLSGSNLVSAKALSLNAERAVFDSAQMDFFRCEACRFQRASLQAVSLRNSILSGSQFNSARLTGVEFASANLTNVDFAGAQMDGAMLAGADVAGANFTGVDLTRTDLRLVLNLDLANGLASAKLPPKRLLPASFKGVKP
ncbi:hypothetical protein GRI43_08575 [Altererythrobacter luteolus]|uniref:Pentapeptide repeat-containing protein n=1 Tax=Pontixanthobacter luteolus TaxID=295089 RepID=A0A6I4V584_9SPHN|nr:pentapeptide repeat-containing protein [Pontixanthobacter luteolus]MXP47434.1 hypothetical protein [Pontixanthobacter luteolus]